MESSHEPFERRANAALNELLIGFGALLKRKGVLVDSNPEDGYSFAMSATDEMAEFGAKIVRYSPRYYFNGMEFSENLSVEIDDDGIDRIIFIARDPDTGLINTNVWLDAARTELSLDRIQAMLAEELSEEEMRNIVDNLDFQLAQTIEMEDLLMLQRLLTRLRTALD